MFKKNTEKINNTVVNQEPQKTNLRQWTKLICKDYVLIIAIAVLIFRVLFGTCWVNGRSMVPTFHNGDFVFFSRIDRNFSNGDVIIASVKLPEEKERLFFKRVIASAGDTIEIDEANQQVIRNGEVLYEPYVNPGHFTDGDMDGPVTVPDGYVFAMGDNRPESNDSRDADVGLIPVENIRGKVLFRIWSLSSK